MTAGRRKEIQPEDEEYIKFLNDILVRQIALRDDVEKQISDTVNALNVWFSWDDLAPILGLSKSIAMARYNRPTTNRRSLLKGGEKK